MGGLEGPPKPPALGTPRRSRGAPRVRPRHSGRGGAAAAPLESAPRLFVGLGEDVAEEVGDAGGGVGADLLFFLADDVEEAVEALADHVVVQVEGVQLEEGDGVRLAHEILVLAGVSEPVAWAGPTSTEER